MSSTNDVPPRAVKKKKKRSSVLNKKRKSKSPLALEKQQRKINESAATIQANIRGHLSRKRVANMKKEKEQEDALVTIQKNARGYLSRKRVESIKLENEREIAIKKIQANARGYLTRKVTNETLNVKTKGNAAMPPLSLSRVENIDAEIVFNNNIEDDAKSHKSNYSNSSNTREFIPPPPSSPSQQNKPRLRSRKGSRNSTARSNASSTNKSITSITSNDSTKKKKKTNGNLNGEFLSKELKLEMEASDLELNRAKKMLVDLRHERAQKEEAYRVLGQGLKEKEELDAMQEQLNDINNELQEERKQKGNLIQELKDLKEELALVDEKRQRAEAAVIDVDETMKARDRKMRELEREVEMLKRKVKTAREDARLQAEIEIERLKTELECRTQLLNMRWQRHEEMMRESYDRQTLKGSASIGQLPLIYSGMANHNVNSTSSPPGLNHASSTSNLMHVPNMEPQQHHYHPQMKQNVAMGGKMPTFMMNERSRMSDNANQFAIDEMPPLLPLATIGGRKNQDSPGQPFSNNNIHKRDTKASSRSTGSRKSNGSYNLNYQKQKRAMVKNKC
jgi:myosin heavy subunit